MAVKNLLQIFLVGGLLLLFSGCLPKQEDVKNIFQTDSATIIKNDYNSIREKILSFKEKLDIRNPNSYSKKRVNKINSLIKNSNKNYLISYHNMILENYKDYLQLAFSKTNISNRNDYLVLGLYYLVYELYEVEKGHRLAGFMYDSSKLQKLYKNIQILNWKIKNDRDLKQNYLFLTWQNNWQVELEKKETIFDSSNFNFEILLIQINDRVKNSLKTMGEEPKDLSISTLKSMFLFL